MGLKEESLSAKKKDIQYQPMVMDIEMKRINYQQSIANLVFHKNYIFPGDSIHERVLDNIQDLDIRDDDIFIVSYPANGGHYLEDIVLLLIQKDWEKKQIIDENSVAEENGKSQLSVARLESANLYGHIRWLNSIKSPRIISTSLPYDLLPQQLQTPNNSKIIYLGRNSKDHIVAYYYHHRLKGIQISLDDFIELYLNGYLLYGNYFDHVISYWQLSKLFQNNVLFLSYEEVKIMTLTMAEKIVQFLNLNLDKNEIEEIIINKQGKTNAFNSDDLRRIQDPERNHSKRLNKFHNVLGDWDNYLNLEQIQTINDMIGIKFESQNLKLIDNAEQALENIEKYGRILKNDNEMIRNVNQQANKLTNGYDRASIMMSLASSRNNSKTLSTNRKKLVLTKDEAMFIRKKDKVVIVEDNGNDNDPNDGNWLRRILAAIINYCCCCFGAIGGYKRKDYNQF